MIRRQRGLSQAQLAHPELSDSYVSLIESGKRTPTPAVLELLATKLECSLTYLINGVTAEQMEELEMGLRFAQLALENGEVAEARRRYAELLADSNLGGLATLRQDAEYGLALATEACGDLDEAIAILNRLREADSEAMAPERRTAIVLALCRCYRERGDFTAAVQIGEEALWGKGRPTWDDDLIELGATLLAAYLERGDLLRAQHFTAELLNAAEALGTPRSTVAVCWNAAIVAEQVGQPEEAMNLIEKAMAIQSETGAARNLVRLRVAYAGLMLKARPQDAETARTLLLRSWQEMDETAVNPMDRLFCAIELARAEMMLGRPESGLEYAQVARDLLAEDTSGMRANAHLVLGQVHHMLHRDEEAGAELAQTCEWLNSAPSTREMAEIWTTTAEMFSLLGDHGQSVTAYRRALECAGL